MMELNTQPIMKFIENNKPGCSSNASLKNPIPNSSLPPKWKKNFGKTLQTPVETVTGNWA
jgi:hypothetical protein